MTNIKCNVKTEDDEYDNDFDASFIDRVKQASHLSGRGQGFKIKYEYEDEDGHNEVEEPIEVTSWDDMDKIACIVLTHLVDQHGGFSYSTLTDLEVTGAGKILSFDVKKISRIVYEIWKLRDQKEKEQEEKKEFERLQAKYGKK